MPVKRITVLEDLAFQPNVISQVAELPISPTEGDRYILTTDNTINTYYDGDEHNAAGWLTDTPEEGWRCTVLNPAPFDVRYTDGAWVEHQDVVETEELVTEELISEELLTEEFEEEDPVFTDWRDAVRAPNTVLAGPTAAPNAAATFRQLGYSELSGLPTIPVSQGQATIINTSDGDGGWTASVLSLDADGKMANTTTVSNYIYVGEDAVEVVSLSYPITLKSDSIDAIDSLDAPFIATANNHILTKAYWDENIPTVPSFTGNTNYLPKRTAGGGYVDSQIFDNGTNAGINTIAPTRKFDVNGTLRVRTLTTQDTYTYLLVSDSDGNVDRILKTSLISEVPGGQYDLLVSDGSGDWATTDLKVQGTTVFNTTGVLNKLIIGSASVTLESPNSVNVNADDFIVTASSIDLKGAVAAYTGVNPFMASSDAQVVTLAKLQDYAGDITHNSLSGLQGGSASEPAGYYHLSSAQHTIATQAASATVAGYITTAAQTLAGVKTFNSFPVKSGTTTALLPTTAPQLTTKYYVDEEIGKLVEGGTNPSQGGSQVLNAATDTGTWQATDLKVLGDTIFSTNASTAYIEITSEIVLQGLYIVAKDDGGDYFDATLSDHVVTKGHLDAVIAGISPSVGMNNPMLNRADLIYGGAGGTPLALSVGTTGQIATREIVGGFNTIAWKDIDYSYVKGITSGKLLGRYSASPSPGAMQMITVGAGLELTTGGELNATGTVGSSSFKDLDDTPNTYPAKNSIPKVRSDGDGLDFAGLSGLVMVNDTTLTAKLEYDANPKLANTLNANGHGINWLDTILPDNTIASPNIGSVTYEWNDVYAKKFIASSQFKLGGWTIILDGSYNLTFNYSGIDRMKLQTDGNAVFYVS